MKWYQTPDGFVALDVSLGSAPNIKYTVRRVIWVDTPRPPGKKRSGRTKRQPVSTNVCAPFTNEHEARRVGRALARLLAVPFFETGDINYIHPDRWVRTTETKMKTKTITVSVKQGETPEQIKQKLEDAQAALTCGDCGAELDENDQCLPCRRYDRRGSK